MIAISPGAGSVGFSNDPEEVIQRLRRVEESQREAESQLRAIGSGFPGVIFQLVVSGSGTRQFRYISDQCKELLGVTAPEVYADAKLVGRFISTVDLDHMGRLLEYSRASMEPWTPEFGIHLGDRHRQMRADATPIQLESGSTVWSGAITDITEFKNNQAALQAAQSTLWARVEERTKELQAELVERRKIEEELHLAKDLAEAANQSKSNFLANMSHELRTPLNAVIGFADVMRKEMFGPIGTERYKEYLGDISTSANHLLDIIGDILDIARIESGKYVLEPSDFQIQNLISETARFLKQASIRRGVTVVIQPSASPPLLHADHRAVRQMLLNLMSNAIKFTPAGGRVTVAYEANLQEAVLTVADTGIGIERVHLEKLAQPFYQIGDPTTRSREGTGLGLALTKTLIELHGGKMSIDSVPGEGTDVTLVFPVSR
ncbi:MAG: hypothetical protein HOH65_22415 [Rhodospirillaceae bacterium]|jgi:signal transduction histidine kinase|nr:hypothetical protein [Rhodospirillaceae bacterium]